MALRTLHLVALLALLTACQHGMVAPPADVRTAHLRACQAYTDVLTSLEVWQRAGRLSVEQDEALRRLDRTTTPLCLGEPSETAADLVRAAVTRLEVMLLDLSEGGAS